MKQLVAAALFLPLSFSSVAAPDDDVKKHRQALDTAAETHESSEASQKRVSRYDEATRKLREKFLTTTLKTEKLNVYVKQVEELLAQQAGKKADIERQKAELQQVERDVLPLMQEMIDTLADFVGLDLPFKADERVERIEGLRETLKDPEQAVASKYRKILEAWQKELDYGNAIGSWRQELLIGVESRTVDFLHVGRVAMFYQTLDGKESGMWNQKFQRWEVISGSYSPAIRRGIRMAREQAAPDLLDLPMPAPQSVSMAGGAG